MLQLWDVQTGVVTEMDLVIEMDMTNMPLQMFLAFSVEEMSMGLVLVFL